MKKRGRSDKEDKDQHSSGGKKSNSNDDKDKDKKSEESAGLDDESENQGFGMWLRSADGVEMMRLFVIANSLLVFVTMAWPNMQEALYIIKDYIMGEEEDE